MANDTIWRPYTQMKTAAPPLQAVRTEGTSIHLADGRVLIDGIASWWTACHGYNHPHIQRGRGATTARDAAHHVRRLSPTRRRNTLAARLTALAPGSLEHVFFCDSGSVAVEVAMKMAVQYWLNRGIPRRTRFLSRSAMDITATPWGRCRCATPTPACIPRCARTCRRKSSRICRAQRKHVGAFDSLLAVHAHEIAAVIVEPLVQGAGGMRFHTPGELAQIAAAAQRHGLLLIADEIFTGFGRTGTMFACEQANVAPDILCVSKALTGGTMGLAATLASRTVFEAFWSDEAGDRPDARADLHGQPARVRGGECVARSV